MEAQQTVEAVRTVRVIVAALMSGLVMITAVFYMTSSSDEARFTDQGQAKLLGVLLPILAVSLLFAWQFVKKSLVASWRAKCAPLASTGEIEEALTHPFLAFHIVGAAIAEGCGVVAATFYMVTGQAPMLFVVGLAVLAMSRFYPDDRAFQRFVEMVSGVTTNRPA